MTTLREAAQQALEALEWYAECSVVIEPAAAAITALRAALAEPVQELAPFAALVATAERERIIAENAPVIEKINAHIKALEDEAIRARSNTAPPQRKPLTDYEIADVYLEWDAAPGRSMADFARAIERAHGIGDSNG